MISCHISYHTFSMAQRDREDLLVCSALMAVWGSWIFIWYMKKYHTVLGTCHMHVTRTNEWQTACWTRPRSACDLWVWCWTWLGAQWDLWREWWRRRWSQSQTTWSEAPRSLDWGHAHSTTHTIPATEEWQRQIYTLVCLSESGIHLLISRQGWKCCIH